MLIKINANFAAKKTKQEIMKRILTKKEYEFVKDFIVLIKKYKLLFSANEAGHIVIIVNEKEEDGRDTFLRPSIELGDCFDETELNEILSQTEERIKQIAEEFKSEDIFINHIMKD